MIFILDFDKTITLKDSTDEFVRKYDEQGLLDFMTKYRAGQISIKEYLSGTLALAGKIGREEFEKNMGDTLKIDPYFKEFLRRKPVFKILSAATVNNICVVLEKNEIEIPIEDIYSSKINFSESGIEVEYELDGGCGFCGTCKKEVVEKLKKEFGKVIYVGDGTSDICGSQYADVVFCKVGEKLQKYYEEKELEYIPFSSFKDIIRYIEENNL